MAAEHDEQDFDPPDYLSLDLSVTLRSDEGMYEAPWEVWSGRVRAGWWAVDDDPSPTLREVRGLHDTPAEIIDGQVVEVTIGRVELYLLRLEEVADGQGLFDAADEIDQLMANTVEPIVDTSGEDHFNEEVLDIVGDDWLDQLLILNQVELVPAFRGQGLGAWTAARAIGVLGRDSATLVVAKAAPLHRDDFMTPGGDEHRDMTAEESARWTWAQQKITQHWQSTLGLQPLPSHPSVLVGLGGLNDERRATLAKWGE